MDSSEEIMRSLGRIEGELIEIRKLSARVLKLEIGWAVVAAAYFHWFQQFWR